ncbi:hypothetical protein T07_12810 [Trichinella nelsoni]|uniref:Uncharacterized protein n=1 Tax=Trichinella nelsoni TaxID=6336 RepID=A0A0V0SHF3_9BILA|nr:hypothetical protein T07_12810 [Trichinella nelsoni]
MNGFLISLEKKYSNTVGADVLITNDFNVPFEHNQYVQWESLENLKQHEHYITLHRYFKIMAISKYLSHIFISNQIQ